MESLVNNIDLFMMMRNTVDSLSDSTKLCECLKEKMKLELSGEKYERFLVFCQSYCSRITNKWKKASRNLQKFLKQNEEWLDSPIAWPDVLVNELSNEEVNESLPVDDVVYNVGKENVPPATSEASTSACMHNKRSSDASTSTYTPKKPYQELSDKQKRRRVDHSVDKSLSPEELSTTAVRSLQYSGHQKVSQIIEHLLENPGDVDKIVECLKHKKKGELYTPEKALGLIVSLKLSKWQYLNLRDSASEQGCDIYPSYYKIKQIKTECYPSKEDTTVSEDGAVIKLQALLDLTVTRLISAHNIIVETGTKLKLISKWGFDGASGQSNYKQPGDFDDSSIFMTCMVPLRLLNEMNTVIWENDRPSSTFYCRPIMFKYIKETKEVVMSEMSRIREQIETLEPTRMGDSLISHDMLLTMIDGKITSIISDTSSAACDICNAKPSEMNNLSSIRAKQKNEEIYQYGLSSLHAWIRCMECLLHIGMNDIYYNYITC